MFSIESVKKCVSLLKDRKKYYFQVPAADIKICVSKGNKKIGRVLNVSLPPVLTCANCAECKFYCYDIKACLQYSKTVIDARIRNLCILEKDRDLYFSRIEGVIMRRRTNKYFRWHVSGDIVDLDYFSRMVEIARRHSDFQFWTYTKNYQVVNTYCEIYGRDAIPANFSIMFSEWRGLPMDNPYGFPVFSVVFKGDEKPQGFYCPGNCDLCKAGKLGCIGGRDVFVNEH